MSLPTCFQCGRPMRSLPSYLASGRVRLRCIPCTDTANPATVDPDLFKGKTTITVGHRRSGTLAMSPWSGEGGNESATGE